MKIISENDVSATTTAVDFLRAGKIIFFATDTVYGMAADAANERAVAQIYQLKNRQTKKPIAIFLQNLEQAKKIFIFDEMSEKIAQKFSQNSLTLVLKKRQEPLINLAKSLNKNDDFLGFRIVNKKFINDLLQNFGGVLAVTSANISGDAAAICADDIKKYFHFNADALLIDGGICAKKIPSTVIKIDNGKVEILRQGENFIID